MASSKEAGIKTKGLARTAEKGSSSSQVDNDPPSSDIGRQVEEYLTSIQQELSRNDNPRLRIEESRLVDLLESYKKLCKVYERRRDLEDIKVGKKELAVPEICTVLYPELYADKNEKEKDKFRRSLIKGRPSTESCVPKNYRVQGKVDWQDVRQKEKDRFIRLVSSAPSVFLQGTQRKQTRRLPLSSTTVRVQQRREDSREKEKERLAKILSSDIAGDPSLKRRPVTAAPAVVKRPPNTVSRNQTSSAQPALKRETRLPPSKVAKQPDNVDKSGMVRRDVSKRLGPSQGLDKQDRRRRLLQLNNREYQEYLDKLHCLSVPKMDKAVLAREASLLDLRDEGEVLLSSPRSVTSVGTQTDDDRMIPTPPSPSSPQFQIGGRVSEPKLFPVQKEAFITSPRAKLIKDLHGVSPCLPGASPLLTLPEEATSEEKKKRSAYAEALKAQIDEKRRLEEEKRRRELEEDECIERKAREQQERLKEEWEREQSNRHNWLMQKEAQEESVRQKMMELELEAKELKRRERRRRGLSGSEPMTPTGAVTPRQKLSPREVEQLLPQAIRDSMMTSLIMDKPRPKTLQLETNNNSLLNGQADVERSMTGNVGMSGQEVEAGGDVGSSPEDGARGGVDRPPSPIIPAIQTDSILRRSLYSSPRLEMIQGENERDELLRGKTILTQLGVFRRELELEQEKMQQKLSEQSST